MPVNEQASPTTTTATTTATTTETTATPATPSTATTTRSSRVMNYYTSVPTSTTLNVNEGHSGDDKSHPSLSTGECVHRLTDTR